MGSAIRVSIQQPALPAYRVPVFRELNRRADLDVHVHYARLGHGPANVAAEGFQASEQSVRRIRIGSHALVWHGAQWRLATRRHSDVLVLAWDVHYLGLLPALLRARAAGVGTVLWGHGYSKRETKLRRTLRNRVAKLADVVMTYSRGVADSMIEAGFAPDRVFVAQNAVDQQPIQQARAQWQDHPEKLQAFRREQGLTSGPCILYVSRLDPNNRTEFLIEATAKLKSRWPDIQTLIVGGGEPQLTQLKAQAHQLGVQEQVRFLGPIYGEDQLAPWFCCADVFGYPTHIGLSLMHAMGYGLPVVTSDRRSAHGPEFDALEHGVNGMVYADGSVDAFTEALSRILEDAELKQRLSQAALQTVTQQFSLDNMVDGFEQAIRAAFGRHQRS